MRVIGYQRKDFSFVNDKGEHVSGSGYYLYLSEERKGVEGFATSRIFVSDSKLAGYVPNLTDEITVSYNQYGKIAGIIVH